MATFARLKLSFATKFFYSSAWSLEKIIITWIIFCQDNFQLVHYNGRLLIVGDDIKIPKDSQCQPHLKFLRNSSQNQNKPKKFWGHHFGAIACIAQIKNQFRAILQAAQIYKDTSYLDQAGESGTQTIKKLTSISSMLLFICRSAIECKKPVYAVLDAFFSSAGAFTQASERLQENGTPWVHLITRAKKNYVAYTEMKKSKKTRVALWSIFNNKSSFTEITHPMYPDRWVKCCYADLYWGNSLLYLRFVFVIDGDCKFILMCSDTTLCPIFILSSYALRNQIELSFRTLKHIIGGFGYRFWLSFLKKNHEKNSLLSVEEHNLRIKRYILKLHAIERYVNLAIIAQGMINYFALMKSQWIWSIHYRTSWLRSYSSILPSTEVTQRALQSYYLLSLSWDEIKRWVYSQSLVNPIKSQEKVCKNHTLEHNRLP